MTKWKCRPSTNNNPSPNTQPPIGIPQVINLTYNAFQAISPTNILEIFNEESTLLSITTIPDIILTTTVGLPQYLTIGGTAPALGNYTNILTFRGDTSGLCRGWYLLSTDDSQVSVGWTRRESSPNPRDFGWQHYSQPSSKP